MSHAASFGVLGYVSGWIKCVHPDVFAAALVNSQPMGFYAPAQIVRDGREQGVEGRAGDVNHSDWDCTLEAGAAAAGAEPVIASAAKQSPTREAPTSAGDCRDALRAPRNDTGNAAGGRPALRLGFREVNGLAQDELEAKLVKSRGDKRFRPAAQLQHRTALSRPPLVKLSKAATFRSLGPDRRRA